MRAFLGACAIAILGLSGLAGQSFSAEPTPRVAYLVGGIPPMPDADLTIDVLTRRLGGLQLNPSIRQQGTTLRIEIDRPADDLNVGEVLTRRGC